MSGRNCKAIIKLTHCICHQTSTTTCGMFVRHFIIIVLIFWYCHLFYEVIISHYIQFNDKQNRKTWTKCFHCLNMFVWLIQENKYAFICISMSTTCLQLWTSGEGQKLKTEMQTYCTSCKTVVLVRASQQMVLHTIRKGAHDCKWYLTQYYIILQISPRCCLVFSIFWITHKRVFS